MAAIAQKLSVAEFEQKYGHEKPYYEFWHGEAIQKSMATWHGLVVRILMDLLTEAGFKAATEVTLKIDPDFHPIPDVIGTRGPIEHPNPTRATEVVVEVLSADDPMSLVLYKCRAYQAWGYEQIYVVDPSSRLVFRWVDRGLEEAAAFASIPVNQIWLKLDAQLQP
jgi:Uma2 family endonuclease